MVQRKHLRIYFTLFKVIFFFLLYADFSIFTRFSFLFYSSKRKRRHILKTIEEMNKMEKKIPLMLFMFLPLSVREVKNYFFFLPRMEKSYRLNLLCEIKSIVIRQWGGGEVVQSSSCMVSFLSDFFMVCFMFDPHFFFFLPLPFAVFWKLLA